MSDLSAFPITAPLAGAASRPHPALFAAHAQRREGRRSCWRRLGLPYEPHLIDIGKNESWTPEFLSLNPNGKIPAIIDPDGPGGKPLGLFEIAARSCSISPRRPAS